MIDDSGEDSRHGPDGGQGQTRRLEIRRQQDEDDEHGDGQADAQRLEHLGHGRQLAHLLDAHAARRRRRRP